MPVTLFDRYFCSRAEGCRIFSKNYDFMTSKFFVVDWRGIANFASHESSFCFAPICSVIRSYWLLFALWFGLLCSAIRSRLLLLRSFVPWFAAIHLRISLTFLSFAPTRSHTLRDCFWFSPIRSVIRSYLLHKLFLFTTYNSLSFAPWFASISCWIRSHLLSFPPRTILTLVR